MNAPSESDFMKPNEASEAEFVKLWKACGGQRGESVYRKVAQAYGAPNRANHTLTHIGWVLRRLAEFEDVERHRGAKLVESDWLALRLAAWFHDYEVSGHPEDEKNSGEALFRFVGLYTGSGVSGELWGTIHHAQRLIMATAHKRVPLEYDAAILCDCDLSIFGADPDAFDAYEARVRQEWAHVPEELFNAARATILQRFRSRPRIYMTLYGREQWERKAMTNLDRSIARLTR